MLPFVLVLILGSCAVEQQVRPENPTGAAGLVPTQEDKDIGRVAVQTGFDLKRYRIAAGEAMLRRALEMRRQIAREGWWN